MSQNLRNSLYRCSPEVTPGLGWGSESDNDHVEFFQVLLRKPACRHDGWVRNLLIKTASAASVPGNPLKNTISYNHPVAKLYEDDLYIVFEKPSGLLVIPTPQNEQRTLVNIVNQQYAAPDGTGKLHPCHRIDQETSGAIIFAKGKRAQKLMMDLFKQRAVAKKYIAFIHGKLKVEQGEITKPIQGSSRDRPGKQSRGVTAITAYKVLKVKKGFSILEVRPITGRTNQIRIHFSEAGHPLVGDRKFAFARDYALKFRRTALHAASLEWVHPVSRKKIRVESGLPKDMEDFLKNY